VASSFGSNPWLRIGARDPAWRLRITFTPTSARVKRQIRHYRIVQAFCRWHTETLATSMTTAQATGSHLCDAPLFVGLDPHATICGISTMALPTRVLVSARMQITHS